MLIEAAIYKKKNTQIVRSKLMCSWMNPLTCHTNVPAIVNL